jgi:NAD-dependent DNA ligase
MTVDDNKDEDKVQVVDTDIEMIHSPKKVTCTATVHSGISKEMTEEQKSLIRSMVDEWTANHKNEQLPPQLAAFAARAGLTLEKVVSTPSRRGKKDKVKVDTPAASEGAISDSLQGLRFVLSGTWPGGQGLTSGKLCVKSRIKKFGGSVTSNYSRLTNFLVVGTNPGPKKIIDMHKRKLKIIDINQLTKIMVGELVIKDLVEEDYSEVAITVLEAGNI